MPDSELAGNNSGVNHDVYDLLAAKITYDGWEIETATQKSFYVRGYTWFRQQVLNGALNVSGVAATPHYIEQMQGLIQARPNWMDKSFPWNEKFGPRQFVNAFSAKRVPCQFHKAAQVVALCEVVASDLHERHPTRPHPSVVLQRMRIEPAVSYVHDLSRPLLERIERDDPSLFQKMRQWTGQKSPTVFYDMADNKTVTHKLARWTRAFILARYPNMPIGDVGFRYDDRRIYKPSENEYYDANEQDLPEEARAAIAQFEPA